MRRIVEAAGGILYRWKDDAEPTRASSPSVKSNIATDGTIIANTTDSDGETTAAPGASDAASTPDPAQADSPATADNVLNRIELCIVHRPKYDDWSWPKGKVDPNESHRHAAVREIGEESGLSVELGPYLGDIEYPLSEEGSKQRHTKDRSADTKHIQFWMATPISAIDNLRRTHAFGPVHRADIGEIDEVLWLTPAEARKKLSHSTDKDILALFVDRVQEGALDAVPVIIVRHGKAEARKLWKGSDANRPITPRGAAAAYALNRELACFNPTRLATSPWVRHVRSERATSTVSVRHVALRAPCGPFGASGLGVAAWSGTPPACLALVLLVVGVDADDGFRGWVPAGGWVRAGSRWAWSRASECGAGSPPDVAHAVSS